MKINSKNIVIGLIMGTMLTVGANTLARTPSDYKINTYSVACAVLAPTTVEEKLENHLCHVAATNYAMLELFKKMKEDTHSIKEDIHWIKQYK